MLRIYNTLTRRKEEFHPIKHNFVRMYVCGLTVYDFMHIGHARTYLFWDVLRRYLDFKGYDVFAVINNTDIDDKIIARSNELGINYRQLAEFYTSTFYEDLSALGALPYTITCNATDFIPQMIETIKLILANGYGYTINGDVFFSVEKYKDYGRLSGYSLEDLIAGARVEVDERKKHPADFALWKSAKPGEPYWESPWGKGRPGWHIECSTMAYHFFGETYDIKGGGIDNLFPHHENEIAQTFGAYGVPLAKYYMHPEHLLVDGVKMSKSLGNFITVRQLLQNLSPLEVRHHFLTSHYLTQMNLTQEGISSAKEAVERLSQFSRIVTNELDGKVENEEVTEFENLSEGSPYLNLARQLVEAFVLAMDNDLNTSRALAEIHNFISSIYKTGIEGTKEKRELKYAYLSFEKLCKILGLDLKRFLRDNTKNKENSILKKLVEELINRRDMARKARDFKTADSIKQILLDVGVTVEDTQSGTRWHFSK